MVGVMPFHRTTKLHNVPSRTIKDDAELAMEKVPDRSHGVPGLHILSSACQSFSGISPPQ